MLLAESSRQNTWPVVFFPSMHGRRVISTGHRSEILPAGAVAVTSTGSTIHPVSSPTSTSTTTATVAGNAMLMQPARWHRGRPAAPLLLRRACQIEPGPSGGYSINGGSQPPLAGGRREGGAHCVVVASISPQQASLPRGSRKDGIASVIQGGVLG